MKCTTRCRSHPGIYDKVTPSGRIYVGKSFRCIYARVDSEFRLPQHEGKFHRNCMLAYKRGEWREHYYEALPSITEDELNLWESSHIEAMDAYYYDNPKRGLNMTLGGDGSVGGTTSDRQKEGARSRMKAMHADPAFARAHAVRCAAVQKNPNTRRKMGDTKRRFSLEELLRVQEMLIGLCGWDDVAEWLGVSKKSATNAYNKALRSNDPKFDALRAKEGQRPDLRSHRKVTRNGGKNIV